MGAEQGEGWVEVLGALPVVLLVGAVLLQLLALGYSAALAGSAAEAGALALAGGGDAVSAARNAIPGWSRAGMRVESEGGRVAVRLRPPSPLSLVRRKGEGQARGGVGDRWAGSSHAGRRGCSTPRLLEPRRPTARFRPRRSLP